MDDGTMASTDEAMALIRAADADPRGTVLMLLRVLGSGLATATRERDEARAEVKDLRTALEYFGGRDDARIADLERAASSLSDEVTQRRFERDTATRERDALRSLREMDAERVAALEEALRATLSRWRATRGRYTPLPHCDVCGVRLAADGTETHDAECAVGRDLRVLGGGAR